MSLEAGRYAPAERLMAMGLALSESRGGLTLDELAEQLGVGRRTTERLRDTLDRLCGGLESRTDDDGRKRWTLPLGRFSPFSIPVADELAELKSAARRLRQTGAEAEALLLERLTLKVEAMLPRSTMRRLEPDVELLMEATGALVRPGPRVPMDPQITMKIREAILEGKRIVLTYRRRDTGELSHPKVCPYGFLSAERPYLVAFNLHPKVLEYRVYVLANIEGVEALNEHFERDPEFDLQRFSARSFGVFWDGKTYDVAWRVHAPAANDARTFCFHPQQQLTDGPDGSVDVSFRSSGLTEMAWHLFRWGEHIQILAPPELKDEYIRLVRSAETALAL